MQVLDTPLLRFIRESAPKSLRYVVLLSAVSGLAGGAILAIVNSAAAIETVPGEPADAKTRLLLLFLLAFATLIFTNRLALVHSTEKIEEMIAKMRLRICDKIRRLELRSVEDMHRGETYTAITNDSGLISAAVQHLASTCQQSLVLVAGLCYLAWLSKVAFVVFITVTCISAYLYFRHMEELRTTYRRVFAKHAEFFVYLNHLISGFKELRLSRRKNDELFADMTAVGKEAQRLATRTSAIVVRSALFADVTLYLVLGAIVFILPQLSPTHAEAIVQTTIAVMFVFGPMSNVVDAVPQLSNADAALENLYDLEKDLDRELDENGPAAMDVREPFTSFKEISLENVVFSYEASRGESGFTVGPISLPIAQQEILFLVGGNGSGKTTLMKLLTGLFEPNSGLIRIDKNGQDTIVIDENNRQAYRELFAGVFSDFHLFDRLYGLDNIDQADATKWLDMMQMSDKVSIADGRFTTLDLSTGQRKRLSLIAALLENRQIYVFDEWTADQDPDFRRYFYEEILPKLRNDGKTIVAITHDDRYWKVADRVVHLDYGKITKTEVHPKT